jgi:MYXO-CTERM domain-containing protein
LNLDGLVDAQDYGIIDNWVQFPGTSGYASGDINYDGVIDAADYGIIDNTIQLQGAPMQMSGSAIPSTELAGASAVPEPGGAALLGLCALAPLRRRRATSGILQGKKA